VENLVFKDRVLYLDGYDFKNCAFIGCTLRTTVGNFTLEQCYFGGSWWVYFDGGALNIVKLTRILDWTSPNPGLSPVRDPDGGITIK
jgi:hypothetical protein